MHDPPSAAPSAIRAWCFYDWANSAFATTVMAALFPPFFRSLVLAAGLPEHEATARWGLVTALALLLVALAGPLLGAVADGAGAKKRFLAVFAGAGILATTSFVAIGEADWLLAAALFIVANVGFAASIVFYESLLPHLVGPDRMDRVSARGYAMGYLGGGLLLAVNGAGVIRPETFGLAGTTQAIKVSFLSVALWWGVFSLPLLRRVPEPPSADRRVSLRQGWSRLAATFGEIRRYRQLLLFLVAFWIYNDGIGTIIKMAVAYGDEIGIELRHLITALLLTQFVGIPCTLLFGRLARPLGTRGAIQIALGIYALICVGGFFMRTATHFYLLALAVGVVQGGAQALSRSLFASMVPAGRSAEFFGFYSTSAKFAGIAGPLVFALVSRVAGQSRLSILVLVFFFLVGGALLARVDVDEGRRAASGDGP